MFGKNPRMNPLESRKQLLIAESELNRAQLVGDHGRADGGRSHAHRSRQILRFDRLVRRGAGGGPGGLPPRQIRARRRETFLAAKSSKARAWFPPSGWRSARGVAIKTDT